ncbi:MAG: ATP-binding protein [Bacteroidota bacterium]
MRSITIKLIAAFVVIGIISILFIVLLARWNTRTEFNRFVTDRRGQELVNSLGQYYEEHGSWEGLPQVLAQSSTRELPPVDPGPRPAFTLVDSSGRAILEGAGFRPGDPVPGQDLRTGIPIEVNGAKVATLVLGPSPFPNTPRETQFIDRLYILFWYSAGGALVLALLLGVFISRSLTRPIRELTRATHAVSEGDLTQQVPVRSRDELGELARSFNRMSSELARSVNLRRQMTADIAHELRTPLSLILGHAEAVHDGVLPPSAENFEIIREEAGRLEHLVDDLRTLSLADAGELSMALQPVAPEKLLQEVASLYQYQAQAKRISLRVSVTRPLPDLQLDPGRMTQVLTNILDNALRHTSEGGDVTLAARLAPAGVEISVRDTGPGLPLADLDRIFDRFYRADAARRRADGGSGLGLAIARSIVQAHGGTIRAESAPGEGLAILITLPQRPAGSEDNGSQI